MFDSDMKESEKNSKVTITDISPQAFKKLRKYFYHGEVHFSLSTCVDLVYAAEKYMVTYKLSFFYCFVGGYVTVNWGESPHPQLSNPPTLHPPTFSSLGIND